MIRFEWNQTKADRNLRKHEVSFEAAASVFYDECAIQYFDAENSAMEDRYLLLGRDVMLRMLLVRFCELNERETIRIISVRKATASER